jgi:signal transduction histidine kinase
VLLIDGNPTDGSFIRLLLQMGAGMSNVLNHVLDIDAAQRILTNRGADVILLDLPLPGWFGVSAVTELRRRAPDVPIVVLTSRGDQLTAKLALEEGAEDSLIKGDLDGLMLARCLTFAIERNRRRIEREALAARMAQTDRLAAVGLLAAGIAHEINNPLTYVVGNVDLALLRLRALRRPARTGNAPADAIDNVIALLSVAAEGADRVRTIVRDLNTFTRPHTRDPSPVSPVRSLEWVLNVADKETRRTARIVRDVAPVGLVMGDEARLGQIFLALVLNANDAFVEPDPERNRITVTMRTEGDHVLVEVRDNGRGIPKEMIDRIFEPFFTTKSAGNGSGLGLYVCSNLVRQLGGRIEVESNVGVGTIFRVRLPCATSGAGEATPAAAPSARPARVMLVDDDPRVLASLERKLALDFHVRAVPDGDQALVALAAGAFDFVLCDLMLPNGAAIRLFEELRARGGTLADRMVFMTGGAFSPESQQFLRDVPNPCLTKPFTSAELQRALERCRELAHEREAPGRDEPTGDEPAHEPVVLKIVPD